MSSGRVWTCSGAFFLDGALFGDAALVLRDFIAAEGDEVRAWCAPERDRQQRRVRFETGTGVAWRGRRQGLLRPLRPLPTTLRRLQRLPPFPGFSGGRFLGLHRFDLFELLRGSLDGFGRSSLNRLNLLGFDQRASAGFLRLHGFGGTRFDLHEGLFGRGFQQLRRALLLGLPGLFSLLTSAPSCAVFQPRRRHADAAAGAFLKLRLRRLQELRRSPSPSSPLSVSSAGASRSGFGRASRLTSASTGAASRPFSFRGFGLSSFFRLHLTATWASSVPSAAERGGSADNGAFFARSFPAATSARAPGRLPRPASTAASAVTASSAFTSAAHPHGACGRCARSEAATFLPGRAFRPFGLGGLFQPCPSFDVIGLLGTSVRWNGPYGRCGRTTAVASTAAAAAAAGRHALPSPRPSSRPLASAFGSSLLLVAAEEEGGRCAEETFSAASRVPAPGGFPSPPSSVLPSSPVRARDRAERS